jgi:SPP1 gp7 family putative phage head morphogenesis protein
VPDIYAVADAHRQSVLAGERRASVELVRAYGKVWVILRERLASLTAQITAAREAGEEVSISWLYTQNRLASLEWQIQAEMAPLIQFAEASIRSAQALAVAQAVEHSAELLTIATAGTPITSSFALLPTGAIQALIGLASDGSPLRTLLDDLGPDASQRVREALITGVATGQGTREMAKAARDAFGGNMARALTVSRTEVMRAYNEATRISYQDSGVVRGWRWLATKSGRTCPNCLSRDGRFYPLEKPLPAHPRCRCCLTPVVIGVPEPARETAGEWFTGQPEDVQRQVLGIAGQRAYAAGAVTLRSFEGLHHDPQWGDTSYARSLKQVLGAKDARKWVAG